MSTSGIERRHLVALATLLEHDGFARSAEHLFVTPSTFANTIRQIERVIGSRLVERGRQGMRLNARGQEMAIAATKALSQMDAVVEGARRSSLVSRTLFVQTTPTIAEGIGADLLGSLMAGHPALQLSVSAPQRPSVSEVAYAVAAADVDFGMTERITRPIDGIAQTPLGTVQIAYAFPANADGRPATATLTHVDKYGLVVLPHFESSHIYAELRSRTSVVDRFIRARIADRYAFAEVAKGGVAGFFCEYRYRNELEAMGLHVALFNEPLVRRFVTVTRANDHRTIIADVMAQSRELAEAEFGDT